MIILYVGTILMALIIGSVTGLSASPVVGILIPLLFSALTAGGATYALSASEDVAAARRRLLGMHLVLFSIGFLVGLWSGVYLKLHPEALWFADTRPSLVYQKFEYTDALLLAGAIELDRRMIVLGSGEEDRQRVLGQVLAAANGRRVEDGTLASRDRTSFEKVVSPSAESSDLLFTPVAMTPDLPGLVKPWS